MKTASPRRSPGGRVLIVDSDEELRAALSSTLTRAGFRTETVGTGAAAIHQAITADYSLILLDLVLPDCDGPSLLARLVAMDQVVIVVTRVSDAATKVRCLEKGARDYLTKPFAPQELLARIRLRLEPFAADWTGHSWRRGGRPGQPLTSPNGYRRGDVITQGGLRLDVGRLTADCGDGPVQLTRTEFLFLMLLVKHAGKAITSERLRAEVWGFGGTRSNVVCVCVRRLRTKLGRRIIQTVPGKGYCLGDSDLIEHLSITKNPRPKRGMPQRHQAMASRRLRWRGFLPAY